MRILIAGTGAGRSTNFEQTVLTPVTLADYAGALTFTQRQLLSARHGRLARVWGFIPTANIRDQLAPGDQVWFHHAGQVSWIADVVTVIRRAPKFDQALWGAWDDTGRRPGPGFVITLTRPRPAAIAKADLNQLLGHGGGYTWRRNVLLDADTSQLLDGRLALTLDGHDGN